MTYWAVDTITCVALTEVFRVKSQLKLRLLGRQPGQTMQAEDKRMMRAVVRRVHPDLFAAHPYERAKNTESLKVRSCSSGPA